MLAPLSLEGFMATQFLLKPVPYRSEADLADIADLYNACEVVDRFDRGISPAELQEDFADPDFDLAEDLRLWRDDHGALMAVGSLWHPLPEGSVQGCLSLKVHPDYRYQGLEEQVIAWGEARLLAAAQGLDLPVQLDLDFYDTQSELLTLGQNQGFSPIRYFFHMTRSLVEPIPEPKLPAGFTLRTVDTETNAEAWVEMFNQTFIDHWNHHELTLQDFYYYCGLSCYQADLDLVALAPDGTFAAFCQSVIHHGDNLRTGRKEGWIGELGTRRGFRHRGLGRAMLLHGLQRLRAAGMETAILGVDADNPNGALGLYRSVGFRPKRRRVILRKQLA
jgi:mycothiol synthase